MQQTLLEDIVPQSFLIDSFDRFFCKTFEKDSNYGQFQKEWETFKKILDQENIDLDQIFKQIAQVQLNLSQTPTSPQLQTQMPTSSTSNHLEHTPYKYSSPSPISASTNQPHFKNFSSHLHVTTTNDSSIGQFDSPSLPSQSRSKFSRQSPSPLLRVVTSPTIKADISYFSPKVTRPNLDPYNSTPQMSKYAAASPTPNIVTGRNTSIKFQFNSLLDKAKVLKQDINEHSESMTERYRRPKDEVPSNQENRTLLKKIVIYSRDPNFKEINEKIEMKIENKSEIAKKKQMLLYF